MSDPARREAVVLDDRIRSAEVPLSYTMLAQNRAIIRVG